MNADNLNMSFNHEVFNQGKLWLDGWYIYSQGEVSGPYNADQVFGYKKSSFDGDRISVSRKGLSRWYDYRPIQKIFWEQVGLSDTNKNQGKLSRKLFKQDPRKNFAIEKKIRSKHLGTKKTNHWSSERDVATNLHLKKITKKPAVEIRKNSENEKQIENLKQTLAYHHLILKGRLRLGSLHNPLTLILKMIATFGYGWKSWYEQAMIECSYHIDDPNALENLKGLWKVMIPGPHMFKIYSLARLVLQMEVQNHYRRTSPLLSFLLSLVPPLAVIYLQSAINRHWHLHICHFIQNKKYS
ncbi:MAG: hypothetical protein AB8G05_04935 [Oligoflexales bacterium]